MLPRPPAPPIPGAPGGPGPIPPIPPRYAALSKVGARQTPGSAKVTRAAVENAASVAGMVLTTESAVTDVPEKHPPAMPPGGGGDRGF